MKRWPHVIKVINRSKTLVSTGPVNHILYQIYPFVYLLLFITKNNFSVNRPLHLRAMPVVSILMSTMYQYSFVLKGIIRE